MRNPLPCFFRILESRLFFAVVLLLNIVFLCLTRFSPSLDGPAHLYNSNLLIDFISGNNLLRDFYHINSVTVPNWTAHSLLMVLNLLFPGWLAEKLFVIGYVSGMALSFRYFVNQINPDNSYLSLLIFPFINSFLFSIGFYNFSISFIFFFLTFGYYLRTLEKEKIGNYLLLFFLFTITFYSNVLIYSFLGLSAGVLALSAYKRGRESAGGRYPSFRPVLRRLLLLLAVTLPTLILMVLFLKNAPLSSSQEAYSTKELLKWLNDARPFIVYNYPREEVYTEQLTHVLIAFLAIMGYKAMERKPLRFRFQKADIMFIPATISLILLFTVPNASGAGMMSDRLALMFFVFLVAWLVNRMIYSRLNHLFLLAILVLYFSMLNQQHEKARDRLDKEAQSIYETAGYIEENSIVLPVNLTGNWLQAHYSNYLGADKPMVILENYEASVGWFPLKWNSGNMPEIVLGEKHQVPGLKWETSIGSAKKYQIGYVLPYGDLSKLDDENWHELKTILQEQCTIIHESDDGFVRLYGASLPK
jgi:hypothetical protein